MLLELPKSETPRLRRVYGFVAGATLSSSGGAHSPLQFSIVLEIPFYFPGPAARAQDNHKWGVSWVYVRTWAYTPLACLSSPVLSWRAGEPVVGILEGCGDQPEGGSSVLVGWTFCPHAEWNLASPGTFVSADQCDAAAIYSFDTLLLFPFL